MNLFNLSNTKYKLSFIFLFFNLFFLVAEDVDYYQDKKINEFISKMSLEDKAAQVLFVGIDGKKEFPAYMYKYYNGLLPGAVILFKYNIADTAIETAHYIESVKKAFKKIRTDKIYIPALFSTDCEGGSVYRLHYFGSKLPSPAMVATKFSFDEAKTLYSLTAEQINLLGIHLNLAPVVEIETNEIKNFFDERLFSNSLDAVNFYSNAFIIGMKEYNVFSVLKHFPGTGSSDPHFTVSVIDTEENNFENHYILPFKKLLEKNDCAVLISHSKVPFIDDMPFCFSKKGIQNILRNKLNFKGLVITDDISMGALKTDGSSTEDNAILALSAGCDMIMCSENCFSQLVQAISKKAFLDIQFKKRLDEAVFTIMKTKIKMKLLDKDFNSCEKYIFNLKKFNDAKKKANTIVNSKL